jgi:hypothetical protein
VAALRFFVVGFFAVGFFFFLVVVVIVVSFLNGYSWLPLRHFPKRRQRDSVGSPTGRNRRL